MTACLAAPVPPMMAPGALACLCILSLLVAEAAAPSAAASSNGGPLAAASSEPEPEPEAANATIYNTTNGCWVEFIGGTWDSKETEILAQANAAQAAKDDEFHLIKGSVRGAGYTGVGMVLLFAGARFFKPVLFFLGFAAAGTSTLAGLSILVHIYKAMSDDECASCCQYMLVGTMLGAVSGGCAVLWLVKLCYMVLGGTAGGSIGYGAYILVLHDYSLGDGTLDRDGMFYACVCGGALIGAIGAVKRDKALTIFTTSLIGSLMCLKGFDAIVLANFFGRAHLNASIDDIQRLKNDDTVRTMMIAWPIIALLGAHCQRTKTKKEKAAAGADSGGGVELDTITVPTGGESDVIKIGGKLFVAVPESGGSAAGSPGETPRSVPTKQMTPRDAARERMRERERMRRSGGQLGKPLLGRE